MDLVCGTAASSVVQNEGSITVASVSALDLVCWANTLTVVLIVHNKWIITGITLIVDLTQITVVYITQITRAIVDSIGTLADTTIVHYNIT